MFLIILRMAFTNHIRHLGGQLPVHCLSQAMLLISYIRFEIPNYDRFNSELFPAGYDPCPEQLLLRNASLLLKPSSGYYSATLSPEMKPASAMGGLVRCKQGDSLNGCLGGPVLLHSRRHMSVMSWMMSQMRRLACFHHDGPLGRSSRLQKPSVIRFGTRNDKKWKRSTTWTPHCPI